MSEEIHEFDIEAVNSALATIMEQEPLPQSQTVMTAQDDISSYFVEANSTLELLANCITLTVSGRKVCLKLPLNLGKQCIKLPASVPVGAQARACLSIKYKKPFPGIKIPCGVKVTISVNGQTVARQSFGFC